MNKKERTKRIIHQREAREEAQKEVRRMIENRKKEILDNESLEDLYDALSELEELVGKAKPSTSHGFILEKRMLRD